MCNPHSLSFWTLGGTDITNIHLYYIYMNNMEKIVILRLTFVSGED